VCHIDLSEVEKQKLDCHKNEFFISFRAGFKPSSCQGGEISLHEERDGFKTYKIKHTAQTVRIEI
jgi:hypothetical protein